MNDPKRQYNYVVPPCPICIHEYEAVDRSFDVCELHQHWIITICDVCHKPTFSNARGMCMAHGLLNDRLHVIIGTVDPTWYLRHIGQEGQPVSGF